MGTNNRRAWFEARVRRAGMAALGVSAGVALSCGGRSVQAEGDSASEGGAGGTTGGHGSGAVPATGGTHGGGSGGSGGSSGNGGSELGGNGGTGAPSTGATAGTDGGGTHGNTGGTGGGGTRGGAGGTGGVSGTGGAGNTGGVSGSGGRRATGGTGGFLAGAGGGSGTSGAAGLGGQAGQAGCGYLIDDLEDGTGRICTGSGRIGTWYAYNDGYGVESPPATDPGVPILPRELAGSGNGSQRAMYGFYRYPDPTVLYGKTDAWGAGIGFDLAFDGKKYGSFDARSSTGISFLARSDLRRYFLFRVSTLDTTPVAYGGRCDSEYCGAFSHTVYPTTAWVRYTVLFSDLVFWFPPSGDRTDTPVFDPATLTNVQFLITEYPTDTTDGDLWIDDVEFVHDAPD